MLHFLLTSWTLLAVESVSMRVPVTVVLVSGPAHDLQLLRLYVIVDYAQKVTWKVVPLVDLTILRDELGLSHLLLDRDAGVVQVGCQHDDGIRENEDTIRRLEGASPLPVPALWTHAFGPLATRGNVEEGDGAASVPCVRQGPCRRTSGNTGASVTELASNGMAHLAGVSSTRCTEVDLLTAPAGRQLRGVGLATRRAARLAVAHRLAHIPTAQR